MVEDGCEALEVLILDTTQSEGEDNKLYHTREQRTSDVVPWSDLRGVFAAAMGTMRSAVDEDLATAHFELDTASSHPLTTVGFVNLREVLFVMVFSYCALPVAVVKYYTRASCDLLLSLFGHPGRALGKWRCQHSTRRLSFDESLTRWCNHIFQCMRRDLAWETHFHFAVDGCVPIMSFPHETLALLSAFQVVESQPAQVEVVGVAHFYRNNLVVGKMDQRSLRLLHQWMLHGSVAPEVESGLIILKWFDAFEARAGVSSSNKSLLRVQHNELVSFFVVEHSNGSDANTARLHPSSFISRQDQVELARFADSRLANEYEQHLASLIPASSVKHRFGFAVGVDKARGIVYGPRPMELPHTSSSSTLVDGKSKRDALLKYFAFERLASNHELQNTDATIRRTTTWIPSVSLDEDLEEPVMLVPMHFEGEIGGAESTEDNPTFPTVYHETSSRRCVGLDRRRVASRISLHDGSTIWVADRLCGDITAFTICEGEDESDTEQIDFMMMHLSKC